MGKLASSKINGQTLINVNGALKAHHHFITRKRSKLFSVAVLILFFAALGAYFSISPYLSMGSLGERFIEAARNIRLTPFLPDNLHQMAASRVPLSIADHDEETPLIPDAIAEFLSAYSLSKYTNAFLDAIRFGQFKRVAQEIYRTSGYELIRLDHVPEFIRKTHVVLSSPLGAEGRMSHFLFWRPLFRINKFYYSYKGHDIYLLKKKLAALDLYGRRINGVVDTELLEAVVQFQKQMGLEITGFPDDKTVFLACQLANQSDQSLKVDAVTN